jgi:hypothetical protein
VYFPKNKKLASHTVVQADDVVMMMTGHMMGW